MKPIIIPSMATLLVACILSISASAQLIELPDPGTNLKCKAGRRVGMTDIDIKWNAPGVKGREGKIWGTSVAWYGFDVLGFGSYVKSPWRAGADESTNIGFSTDVTVNGKFLPAGNYGFFIAVYPDSCVLIFNKNTAGWGSYFYNSELDQLRVTAWQQKNQPQSKERLEYTFSKQGPDSVELALEWEYWRIPFTVKVDNIKNGLAAIRRQLSGEMGFDPPSLQTAAGWCLRNNVNFEEALVWINTATDPSLGGLKSFNVLNIKSGLLRKLGRNAEADSAMQNAMQMASVMELHSYGRQLLTEKKVNEAMEVFLLNAKSNPGVWPTEAGLMRGYAAKGDFKSAIEHGNIALGQAPNKESRQAIEDALKKLKEGKPL